MRMALLGGTFNPLHNGHIILAGEILNEFSYDRILFVPSFLPAHKDIAGDIEAADRLKMLQLSLEGIPWAEVSDCEIRREGISYTADTLHFVKENFELEGKPGLIIGDDLAEGFHRWRRTGEILEMADLIVAHRLFDKEIALQFPHRYAHNSIFVLSSSEIRDKITQDEDISPFIPEAAARYVRQRKLYRVSP